jgi:tRNA-dihydrouridine synthase B
LTAKIGYVGFDNPFFLAPLAGVTDSPFRRLCKEQGAALVYSEMISAKGLYYRSSKTEELLRYDSLEKPIAYQLFGSEPEVMAFAVEKLSSRGNCMIDVNMGCPVPKVTKNNEGAALMRDVDRACKIVRCMVEAEKKMAVRLERRAKPITVKCRLGWDENSINLREFALRIEEAGASAIAIHARTREQMYAGKADWEKIAEAKSFLSIPVIGNGDVQSGEDANKMLKDTGCDFVMIARGALGNPWIFKESVQMLGCLCKAKVPTANEKKEVILKHIKLQVAEKGERRAVQEMRKHMGWYFKGMVGAADLRRRVNTAVEQKDLMVLLEDIRDVQG